MGTLYYLCHFSVNLKLFQTKNFILKNDWGISYLTLASVTMIFLLGIFLCILIIYDE